MEIKRVALCNVFQMLFLSYDTDRSGRMSSYELRIALNAAGRDSLHIVHDTFKLSHK